MLSVKKLEISLFKAAAKNTRITSPWKSDQHEWKFKNAIYAVVNRIYWESIYR